MRTPIIKKYIQFIKESISKETRVTADISLPEDVINIAKEFQNAGKEIYVVGGAIRDFLKNKEPKDFDLVTNASPDESKKILSSKFKVSDEQGKNFGVIRVYTEDEPLGYEIASFRKDISGGRDTKGEDQKVEIGEHITIKDDVQRRDLTINALFYDINAREIVDLVGGIEDLKSGIIRTVGNPVDRFREDRLRILRVFRFAVRSKDGKIDKETSDAIHNDNKLRGISPKDDVSQERIVEELEKAFEQAISYVEYLELLNEYDMWEQIFPGAKINTDIKPAEHFESYIANLFKDADVSKLEKVLVGNYRFSREITLKIVFLVSLLKLNIENAYDLYKSKERSKTSDVVIMDWLKLNGLESDKLFNSFLSFKLSVKSEDVIKDGFTGKGIGEEIKRRETALFSKIVK